MKYLGFTNGSADCGKGHVERLVLAIDASPSMHDTDWPPSRLQAATEAAIALVKRKTQIAPHDEVGALAYANSSWWLAHPDVVGKYQNRTCRSIKRISTSGATNITSALLRAKPVLLERRSRSLLDRLIFPGTATESAKVIPRIILLTDGHHNDDSDPLPAARDLKEAGVCIDCIGIGGSPNDVDEDLLKEIASKHADGVTPRYAFIGDKSELIQKFEELAGRITR